MFDRFQHHRPMISGVCAWMSDRSDVPVWIIRVVALALCVAHLPLMVIGYFVGAWLIRRQARTIGGGPDRFAQLERRMAAAEEAASRRSHSGFC